jgi:hypothetical protein
MITMSTRRGVTLGALATAGWLGWDLSWPPPDLFILALLTTIVACGGVFGGGLVLAWRHLRQDIRLLRPTTVVLVLLSLPSVTCYQYNTQHTASFLASADSVRGEVTGRNVLGNLLVTFPSESGRLARMVAPKKHAHERLQPGDSIWVYRERVPPHRLDVWPAVPDLRVTANRLIGFWIVGGVLLMGYGPLFRRTTADSKRASEESTLGAA